EGQQLEADRGVPHVRARALAAHCLSRRMRAPNRSEWSTAAAAAGGGLLVAFSMPPWGWWPLAFGGLAIWEALLAGQPRARRWRRTWLFMVFWLAPAMGWMWFLSAPGYVAAVAFCACYPATAVLAMPTRIGARDEPWRWLA